MGPEDGGIVEELHPLQFTGACLVSDRLEFRYRLDGRQPDSPARITTARLVGSGVDMPLTQAVTGVLQAAIPEAGGKLALRVEAVQGCAEGVPRLPWQVDFRLPPEALADYRAAEPIQATAEFPEGVVVRVGRVLRHTDSVIVFWDAYMPGSDLTLTGDIQGDLLAGSEALIPSTYQFGPHGERRKLRPGAKGKAASVMQIAVQAVEYVGRSIYGPPVWCIQFGSLEATGDWRLSLPVPTERPVALAPNLTVGTERMQLTLEEVWLGRSQTVLLFNGGSGALDLSRELHLEDESGRRYTATGGSSGDGRTQHRFQGVPPGVVRLVLISEAAVMRLHGPVAIPLEPGARGRRVRRFPGHPVAGSASPDGMVLSSSRIVFELPDVPPRDEPLPERHGKAPPPGVPQLREWLAERAVPALRMHFQPVAREVLSPLESHVGGPPCWPSGQAWPVCGHCDQPLTFVGQVRLDGEGSPRVGDAELLTLHYCLECIPDGPEQASAYRLQLHRDLRGTALAPSSPKLTFDPGYTPCRTILEPVSSVPHWEDANPQLGPFDLGDDPGQPYCAEAEAFTGAPRRESRLGGYPDWIQGSYWPGCPECGVRMNLVWQLDSEQAVGLMWGDAGRLYMFACPHCCSEQSLSLIMQCG